MLDMYVFESSFLTITFSPRPLSSWFTCFMNHTSLSASLRRCATREGGVEAGQCGESDIPRLMVGFAILFRPRLREGSCLEHGFSLYRDRQTQVVPTLGEIETRIYQRPEGWEEAEEEGGQAAPEDPCEGGGGCLNGAACSVAPTGRGRPAAGVTCLCADGFAGELCADVAPEPEPVSPTLGFA